MSERKAGWYWCKFSATSPWEPNEWNGEEWNGLADYEIGPRIPTPDEMEGWQLMPKKMSPAMLNAVSSLDEIETDMDAQDWWEREILAAAPRLGEEQ